MTYSAAMYLKRPGLDFAKILSPSFDLSHQSEQCDRQESDRSPNLDLSVFESYSPE